MARRYSRSYKRRLLRRAYLVIALIALAALMCYLSMRWYDGYTSDVPRNVLQNDGD